MSAPAVPTPAPQLSQGNAIEYKAFVRKFFDIGAGTLFVMASCYYDIGGMTIFFETDGSGQLSLMELPPSGEFTHLVTAYVTSWTNAFNPDTEPKHLTIVDGHGTHTVHVKPWD